MLNALPDLFQGPRWVQDTMLASPRGATFDYVEPRRLPDHGSPPLLSSYDEPIRRVIEDMREQRMSLCQSLQQYVFVHRAPTLNRTPHLMSESLAALSPKDRNPFIA